MLYVHSFSSIEQILCKQLSVHESITQVDCKLISATNDLHRLATFEEHDTLLYSFQQIDFFQHIETFQKELETVEILINFIKEQQSFSKIILITYPGAYYNSGNMFLQNRGIIESKFMSLGISCTMLTVQAIGDSMLKMNNLHALFYDRIENKYIIPQKSNDIVYSVTLTHLCEIIQKAKNNNSQGRYDVFDQISTLKAFLLNYSNIQKVQRIAPLYLYFKSFMGSYLSPVMFELFLQPCIQMYKFRTEKEFSISLETLFKPIHHVAPILTIQAQMNNDPLLSKMVLG